MSAELTTALVAEIMKERGYAVRRGTDQPIRGGSPDSRTTRAGDLFAAFRGEHRDGNDFVAEAVAAGAAAVICERTPAAIPAGVTVVTVPDTREAVKELASAWLERCSVRVIGITGTVGKTTAKEATAAVLASRFSVHRSPGNMNSREGLPLAVLSLRRDHEISVLEMAMDSPGEILELCEVAHPEIGAVLNIGLTHVSKLGSLEAIAREKLSLVRFLGPEGTAILNVDDPLVAEAVPSLACQILSFGRSPGADLGVGNVSDCGLSGVTFDLVIRGRGTLSLRSPLPGLHTLPAALTAIAAALATGMEVEEAAKALEAARIEGRLRALPGLAGTLILDDSYNSSPASLEGALQTLASIARGRKGRALALLGPMAELGQFEEPEHGRAGRLAARFCDGLYATGEPCRLLVEEARAAGINEAHWFASKEAAAGALAAALGTNDVVLVKASRSTALETVIGLLREEGRP